MAKSVNKVILIGNLGKDPEVKYTPQGTAVAKFSLATNERFKDKQGEWQDRTEWHNITCWARLAEIAGEYLKKGRTVYIEGSLRTDSWDDKQTGQKKSRLGVVAETVQFLGSPTGAAPAGGDGGAPPSRPARPAPAPTAPAPAPAPAPEPVEGDGPPESDDVPF